MTVYPDTYGWDTVFAISIDVVNSALQGIDVSPQYTGSTLLSAGGAATATWQFFNWQIVDANAGNIVLQLSFAPGSNIVIGAGNPIAIDGPEWSCEIAVEALWTNTVNNRLTAHTADGGGWAKIKLVYPPSSTNAALVLGTILRKWFDDDAAALDLFAQELATFDMSQKVGDLEIPWLIPKELGYAGGTMADGVTKAIGILVMTAASGKSASQGQLRLSPYAIPANATAGFLISRSLFMDNMILPAAAAAFSDDSKGDIKNFTLTGDSHEGLKNSTTLTYHMDMDGKSQKCTIAPGNVTMLLSDNALSLLISSMMIETPHPGFEVEAKISENLVLSLEKKTADPDNLMFILSNTSLEKPETVARMESGLAIAVFTIGAVLTVAGLALGGVSFKGTLMSKMKLSSASAKMWARVIAGGVGAAGLLVAGIPTIMSFALDGEEHKLPSFGPLMNTQLSRLKWPGAARTNFVATKGAFANGVLVTVDPRFV